MKNAVIWNIKPSSYLTESHYFSATEPSQFMLCKIYGFHGGNYEECRLLRYKNSVRTSQEIRYVSATEPNRFMLCKICGFHDDGYAVFLDVTHFGYFKNRRFGITFCLIIRVRSFSELGTTLAITRK
jgi:hypothetical protein